MSHVLALIDFSESGAATGHRMVDADAPQLTVTDLAATRGDGVFETASLVEGNVQALDAHLERLAESAQMLQLPAPELPVWREAVLAVGAALTAAGTVEGSIKFVLTRGVEGAGVPTGWVFGMDAPDFSRDRTEGIRIVLLDRGFRHDVPQTSPWLLAGAKIGRASCRERVFSSV